MTNQEQYEKMIIPTAQYTEDHSKMVLVAAKKIKEYCIKQRCVDCAFYTKGATVYVCKISDGLMFTPQEWEV